MTDEERFQKWKSKVELYLEQMVKKSTYEFPSYDYLEDFKNRVPPNVTAGSVIRRAYYQRKKS
jgi:hypothetical protein